MAAGSQWARGRKAAPYHRPRTSRPRQQSRPAPPRHARPPCPEPGGSACCYWNRCGCSVATRIEDSHQVLELLDARGVPAEVDQLVRAAWRLQ